MLTTKIEQHFFSNYNPLCIRVGNSIKLTINPLPKADGPLWDSALFIGMASWYNCSRLADLGAWTRRSAAAILLFLMVKGSLIGED